MRFALARPEHEPQLRAFLREQPMPGWVHLAFEREPDFFQAAATHGVFSQALVALADDATVLGLGERAIRPVYLNGVPASLGYLSGLRSRTWARRGTGLARGYSFLRQLHADGRTVGYLTTIIEENREAQRLLTSGRAGLPSYLDLGRYVTFTVAFGAWRPGRMARRDLRLSRASATDLDEILGFINKHGRRRQFFPVVQAMDFATPQWRGFQSRDFHVARDREGRLAGVVGCWDQSAFKQTRVVRYARPWAWMRGIINVGLRAASLPGLPAAGSLLRTFALCLVCIRDDDPQVLAALLDHLHAVYRRHGFHGCLAGFHERDPLCRAFRCATAVKYRSRLYWVGWDDAKTTFDALETPRIPHLEVAML